MITILIKDDDVLYRYGLEALISQTFKDEFTTPPTIMSEYAPEAIQHADIIILSLKPGEGGQCIPELRMRTKALIIVLAASTARAPTPLPCHHDIILLPRNLPLQRFSQILYFAWKKDQLIPVHNSPPACETCPHKALSGKQHRILDALYRGKSALEIASELRISDKTVYNHKYAVMRKFNLRTDLELVRFLNQLYENNAVAV